MKRKKLNRHKLNYRKRPDLYKFTEEEKFARSVGVDFAGLPPRAKKYAVALIRARGMVKSAAKMLNVTRHAVYDFCKRYNELDRLRDMSVNHLIDEAESQLSRAVRAGDPWAVKTILLSHKHGQARGYGQKMDLELGGAIQVVALPEQRLSEEQWNERFGTTSNGSADSRS